MKKERPEIKLPTIATEITHTLADHEVLLSFNSDVDAEIFHSWWLAKGIDYFQRYYAECYSEFE